MFVHKHLLSVRSDSRRLNSSQMKSAKQAKEPQEDLRMELLHRAPRLPEPKPRAKPRRFLWKCGEQSPRRRRRPECVVCLQVREIRGLPPVLDGRAVAVGWRTNGWRGEMTLPVTVRGGEARFEEIFLHQYSGDAGDAMRGFCIWVSVVEAGGWDLGRFEVDIAGIIPSDRMDAKFGGKAKRFELCGQGKGGELSVSVYCRMISVEFSGSGRRRSGDWFHGVENKIRAGGAPGPKQETQQTKSRFKCFPCLRHPKSLKNRKLMSSQLRRASSRSPRSEQYGFITMDGSIYGERRSGLSSARGYSGFITMEKGAICPPPSSSSFDADDSDGAAPHLLTVYTCSEEDEDKESEVEKDDEEHTDVERIEEEFLQMLEDENDRNGFACDSLEADIDSLIKIDEVDTDKGAHKSRSRMGGVALEEEEYEELLKSWGSSLGRLASNSSSCATSSSSGNCSGIRFGPFGSPF